MIKYKRILLKLSGEALSGQQDGGIDSSILENYCSEIKEIIKLGVEVGVVIGGGNIFRGLQGTSKGYDRYKGDYMGMLATVINGLAIQSMLERLQVRAKVFTAFPMEPVGNHYNKENALEALESGEVVILTAGTGNPYFTTDTAAALRAVELKVNLLLKGTRVDGVYNADPEKDKNAVKFNTLTYDEAYTQNLKIMDLTAFTLCKENNLKIIVFNINKADNLRKIILGEKIGTLVKN